VVRQNGIMKASAELLMDSALLQSVIGQMHNCE